MRDRDEWTMTVTTYEDHLELSLDRELFTRGDVCLDRIELVLPDVYPSMESKDIRAIVHLNEQVIVKGEWKGEKLHLDLTNSGLSPKRLVPETGEIRIEFRKRKQPGTDGEWDAVARLAYKSDVSTLPLAHVSGAILKRKDSSSSEYATTDYPTTDYPSESNSESSSSESESSSSESSYDAVSNGRLGARATPKLARLSGVGIAPSPLSVEPRKRYYYLNDGNRNIIALRPAGGEIFATYTYGTYGQCLKTTGIEAETNPIRYSSEYYDHELGMIYYNYRHYNPQDGRWLSRDPMEEQGGTNLYGFCSNNPVSRVDQLGLDELPGASSTGLSTHWGNIVREKKTWATVCYKYYKAAKELGGNAERDIRELLAKVNKLNYDERDKWVKGYKPLPEPGDLFKVPNTFVIYTTKSVGEDNNPTHPLRDAKNNMLPVIKERFRKSKVNVVEYLEQEDVNLFRNLWKTDGIFGFGFAGHGVGDDEKWYGFGATSDGMNFVLPEEIILPYKLSFIAGFSCGARDMGWGNKGEKYPLSDQGEFVGYWGDFNNHSNGEWNFLKRWFKESGEDREALLKSLGIRTQL